MTAVPEAEIEKKLTTWIEDMLGLTVVSIERQERWRASWFVDTRTPAGEDRALFVRGDRDDASMEGRFEAEFRILQVLEAEGIPVPHIHGMCPDPRSIVMDKADGRPDLSTAKSDEERAAVLDQYMEALADIHAIDPAKFDGIELPRPSDAEHTALVQFENYEQAYRKGKIGPEPVLEYLIGWVRRNDPKETSRVSFLVCDPGQFMFENGRMTALLDLEMAYMGNRIHDLAALQLRDTSEPLGDVGAALRHYEKVTGEAIDGPSFDYHAIAWCVVTPVSMTKAIRHPQPTSNVLQYLEWWSAFCRIPLELIAASTGRDLTPPPAIEPEKAAYAALGESLVGAIEALPVEGGIAEYDRAATARLARFMARLAEYGPGIERQDIAETEALLGERFASREAADAALEAFVQQAGADDDDRLIGLIYNRAHRQCQLFAPFLSVPSVANSLKTYAQLMAG